MKLDEIEEALFSTEQKYPNKSNEQRLDMVCKKFGFSQEIGHTLWCMNVNALMVLKAIENNNDNGLFVQMWYEPEEKKEEPKKEEPKKEEPKEDDNEEVIVFKGWKNEMIEGWSNVE